MACQVCKKLAEQLLAERHETHKKLFCLSDSKDSTIKSMTDAQWLYSSNSVKHDLLVRMISMHTEQPKPTIPNLIDM